MPVDCSNDGTILPVGVAREDKVGVAREDKVGVAREDKVGVAGGQGGCGRRTRWVWQGRTRCNHVLNC